ncbi:GDSL-type esterase/lipase family protein [Ancylobacter sp. MQZ15Z-1]|uniref:GDSL-type esterase/lipase family protein n=1 Tax=Ancylobacter mangrovi TaxID=2972472 RepID=A0A9X2T7B5_9HYPH|nr:GDSL-type esterase/lipase family protein [Ancylobacter mangrovi]MCS0497334.1 GDSL-type esterase/lipase family protein [Ancylobacter mangrovi]
MRLGVWALALAGALLAGPAFDGPVPARAQSDWFRPPGNVGNQPVRQQQRQPARQRQQLPPPPRQKKVWSPFQPLIDLFSPSTPRTAAPSQPRYVPSAPAQQRAAPAIEQPSEPRGQVYASADEARKDSDTFSQFVLVMGDEYADPLAQGLADAFASDRETVAVVGKTEKGSGLGPQSGFDWAGSARQIATASQANIVVVFAGMNDLKPIDDPAGRAEVLDERWQNIYGRRLDEFLLGLKLYGRPVVMVGLPPVEDGPLNERVTKLNALIKEHVERAGLIYADVTDGFVDEDGKFMMSGPDVDGQRRRLRDSDGVGFTRAGGRKLAFFVDKELDHLLVDPADPAAAALSAAAARPSIILLTGGTSAGARVLAGAPGTTPAATPAADEGEPEPARVLVSGAALPSVTGRTDDFRWPAGSPTQPAAAAPSAAGTTTAAPSMGAPASPAPAPAPAATP